MSEVTVKKEETQADGLDPREAQDRLVEAFGPFKPTPEQFEAILVDEASASTGEGETDEEGDAVDAETASDDEDNVVVQLNEDDAAPTENENPFAKEAAEAQALRKMEALLFASPKPLTEAFLGERLPGADVPHLLEVLAKHYENRGVHLRRVDKKWQFVTAPDVADILIEERTQERKLSRAALETMAIIAYHQPCSRADIEEVRGVAVAKGSLDQLLELGWVKIRGRREVPGRPLLYGTTSSFLEHFGLDDLSHLPGMADLKAAGLLDARLPPGFAVPVPKGEDDDEQDGDAVLGDENAEFTADFHDEIEENSDLDES